MASFEKRILQKAIDECKSQFKIQHLLIEQKEAIEIFFQKKNIFINVPTGFGKSLIYQRLPFVADVLYERPRGSSVIVAISPLRSLMNDQVEYLMSIGIPATAISDEEDPDIVQQVMNGTYIVIYGSPECLLSMSVWRSIFQCQSFTEMLIGVAIDEAHCIVHW